MILFADFDVKRQKFWAGMTVEASRAGMWSTSAQWGPAELRKKRKRKRKNGGNVKYLGAVGTVKS